MEYTEIIKEIEAIIEKQGYADVATELHDKHWDVYQTSNALYKIYYQLLSNSKYVSDGSLSKTHPTFVVTLNKNYELEQSIKKTNDAVQENYKSQKLTTMISLGLAVVSTAFIILSTIQTASQQTDTELKLMRIEAQQQSKSIQQLESSLYEINLSIQKAASSLHSTADTLKNSIPTKE